jgi:hypothetical protein
MDDPSTDKRKKPLILLAFTTTAASLSVQGRFRRFSQRLPIVSVNPG